ncbi:MAG: hypothetical protein LBT79_01200, partial [Elusimicrobiota bacterium]|nr:hypothetical protein [Elusimicrobiota bacterium]
SLVGVSKPTIIAYSAAAIYNTKGTMFPSEESSVVGMPNWEIALVAEGLYAASMAQFVKSIVKFFPGPLEPIGYAIAAALLAPSVGFHAYSLVMAIGLDDKKNPMKSYTNAKEKGWAAHLVPFLNSSGK